MYIELAFIYEKWVVHFSAGGVISTMAKSPEVINELPKGAVASQLSTIGNNIINCLKSTSSGSSPDDVPEESPLFYYT